MATLFSQLGYYAHISLLKKLNNNLKSDKMAIQLINSLNSRRSYKNDLVIDVLCSKSEMNFKEDIKTFKLNHKRIIKDLNY